MTEFWDYLAASRAELIDQTIRHLFLVGLSIAIAVAIGVPVSVAVTRRARARAALVGFANVMQTVPSLALFGLLIPLPVIGGVSVRPAIVALVLYALLPIVKNTITGLLGVAPAVREAATAMGMTRRQLLWRVDLPLALPVILAGIRIAAVVTVGTATIAAAAGAEGLGVFIFRGLETANNHALLLGAIPTAVLALLLDTALSRVERVLTRRAAPSTSRAHEPDGWRFGA